MVVPFVAKIDMVSVPRTVSDVSCPTFSEGCLSDSLNASMSQIGDVAFRVILMWCFPASESPAVGVVITSDALREFGSIVLTVSKPNVPEIPVGPSS